MHALAQTRKAVTGEEKHTAQWPSTMVSAAPFYNAVLDLRLGISGLQRL